MTHLTPDELVDAVEGTLGADRRAHLTACAVCEGEVRALSTVLREAQDTPVPDPSPLFWEHFSARVHAAIQTERVPGGWGQWLAWPVLAPMAALALVVVAIMVAVPGPGNAPGPSVDRAAAAADVTLPDEGWLLVADMVGEMDWDTAAQAGFLVQPGSAERAVLELSAPEQQELRRLLTTELERAKS